MSYFICQECGFGSVSWYGRCPNCNSWNSFEEKEKKIASGLSAYEPIREVKLVSLKSVNITRKKRVETNFFEVDRVLGGGLVQGSVIFLTGEPGIGKSTLVIQIVERLPTLYVSGEESIDQVKERADRLSLKLENLFLTNEVQIESIIETIKKSNSWVKVIVIDSIQTVYSRTLPNSPSSVAQIREVTKILVNYAKSTNTIVIIIGHLTKEGEIAGPKTLEHLVDVVLSFEGEKISSYRIIRVTKNRFGSTEEVGILQMTAAGLKAVNHSLAFFETIQTDQPGRAIVGICEGNRSVFFEIQTLVANSILPIPRRVIKGFDYNKFLLLLAVIRKNLNFSFESYDIYVNIVGGFSIKSTAADLGLVASIISSIKNKTIDNQSLFIGEVGLLGEIRKVTNQEKIIEEGKRLGFKRIFSSTNLKSIKNLSSFI